MPFDKKERERCFGVFCVEKKEKEERNGFYMSRM